MVTSAPFVGRQPELQRLRDAFDAARDGLGGIALITGEPGIGKTRLARELESYAAEHGALVLWGRAHEGEGAPPYWPWVQATRSLIEATDGDELLAWLGDGGSEVARIFPALLGRLPNLPELVPITDPQSAQFRLFDAATTFIAGAARATPLVVVLDDLHWADNSTLELLKHAALELGRANLLLIGTYRDVELGRQHPLQQALAGLSRAERFQTVDLRGLSEEDVAAYVRGTTGLEPSAATLDSIYGETEGNAFFLQEVVALMAQEGTLESGEASVPSSVRAAIGQRLDTLSESCNELLRIAAVVGREFSEGLLVRLSDEGADGVSELLESALGAGLTEETGGSGEYRFAHALIQETLLDELRTAQRVRLHARIAEALEQLHGDRAVDHAAELAHHLVESAGLGRDQAERAVYYSRLAAEQAEAQFGWDEAARHYESCLMLVIDDEDRLGEDEAALYEALGRCRLGAAQLRSSWRNLMRAITLYQERGDGVGQARAVLELPTYFAPPERSAGIIDAALETLGDRDPHLRARLLVGRATTGLAGAEQAVEDAASLARTHGFEDVRALLLMYEAGHGWGTLPAPQVERLYREAHEALANAGLLAGAADALAKAAQACMIDGRLDEAVALADEAAEHSRNVGRVAFEDGAVQTLAVIALIRCEFERFEELAAAITSGANLLRASRAEMSGELQGAVELVPDVRVGGGNPWFVAQLHATKARVLLSAGRDEAARREFAQAVELLPRIPRRGPRGLVLALLDRAGAVLGDDAWVRRMYEEYAAPTGPGFSRSRISGTSGRGIDPVWGAFALRLDLVDEAEQHYRSGLEWAEREGCPIEAGRNYQGLAEVAIRRGQTAEARQHLDDASKLFERHGATLYLDQVRARREELAALEAGPASYPAGLSEREVEVLRLMADGKTNAAIAEELVIAPATVASHVRSILTKTNTSNRAAAGSWAARQGLTADQSEE